jgi:hypothetical protein
MKKTLTAIALLAGAVTGFSQGQVQMFDYGGSFAIELFTASSPLASTVTVSYGGFTGYEQQGNTGSDDNPGSASYAGAPLGPAYDVELLAGAGGSTLSQLTPVAGSTVTSWLTGSGAGYWNAPTLVVTVPGVTGTATLAIAAWSSAYPTLAAAEASGVTGVWGVSSIASEPLGFGSTPVPVLPAGITSFSLANTVPEPSTIALGVIGASAFLMRLRRKQ